MQELKTLSIIVGVCVAGVVVSFGGSLWTAYKTHEEKAAQIRPEDQVAIPATAQ